MNKLQQSNNNFLPNLFKEKLRVLRYNREYWRGRKIWWGTGRRR